MNFNDPQVRYRAVLMYVIGEAIESLEDCDSREALLILSTLRSKLNRNEVMSYYESLVFNENAKETQSSTSGHSESESAN